MSVTSVRTFQKNARTRKHPLILCRSHPARSWSKYREDSHWTHCTTRSGLGASQPRALGCSGGGTRGHSGMFPGRGWQRRAGRPVPEFELTPWGRFPARRCRLRWSLTRRSPSSCTRGTDSSVASGLCDDVCAVFSGVPVRPHSVLTATASAGLRDQARRGEELAQHHPAVSGGMGLDPTAWGPDPGRLPLVDFRHGRHVGHGHVPAPAGRHAARSLPSADRALRVLARLSQVHREIQCSGPGGASVPDPFFPLRPPCWGLGGRLIPGRPLSLRGKQSGSGGQGMIFPLTRGRHVKGSGPFVHPCGRSSIPTAEDQRAAGPVQEAQEMRNLRTAMGPAARQPVCRRPTPAVTQQRGDKDSPPPGWGRGLGPWKVRDGWSSEGLRPTSRCSRSSSQTRDGRCAVTTRGSVPSADTGPAPVRQVSVDSGHRFPHHLRSRPAPGLRDVKGSRQTGQKSCLGNSCPAAMALCGGRQEETAARTAARSEAFVLGRAAFSTGFRSGRR